MDYCNQCGTCCRVIRLNISFKEFSKNTLGDGGFIRNNFIPISAGIALKINPFLKKHSDDSAFYYICKKYDAENKKCMVHGSKMKSYMCREYPTYKHNANDLKRNMEYFRYSDNCGYYTGR
jgi:hypothetical protein